MGKAAGALIIPPDSLVFKIGLAAPQAAADESFCLLLRIDCCIFVWRGSLFYLFPASGFGGTFYQAIHEPCVYGAHRAARYIFFCLPGLVDGGVCVYGFSRQGRIVDKLGLWPGCFDVPG